MNQEFTTIGDHLEIISRRKIPFAVAFLLILVTAILLAFMLPATYESQSTIYVKDQQIPEEFVQSTITTYVDEQIQIISAHVLTRRNIEEMLNEFGLFDISSSDEELELAIAKFRDSVVVEPVRAGVVDERSSRTGYITIAFTVAFQHSDPATSLRVAEKLTDLFLKANAVQRTETAAETTEFLQSEAKKLNTEIIGLEWKMSKFKEENSDTLPELNDLNFQQLDRSQRDLEQTERDIRTIQGRQALLNAEISGISPYASVMSAGGEVFSTEDRLESLQRELLTKSSIYSEDHPDIVRLRREIALLSGTSGLAASVSTLSAELESKKTELEEAKGRYSSDHPDVIRLQSNVANLEAQVAEARSSANRQSSTRRAPDNPRYLQVQAQLKQANEELAALYSRRDALRRDIDTYQNRLIKTPETERLWLNLTRDYEVSIQKYRQIRAQIDEAFRAQSLESAQKGEQFLLLEPARMPTQPISPNRPLIFFIGLVFAVVLSLGLVILLETIDTSVRNSKDVLAILGAPPLSTIPVLRSRSDIAASNRQKILITSGFAGFIAIAILVLM